MKIENKSINQNRYTTLQIERPMRISITEACGCHDESREVVDFCASGWYQPNGNARASKIMRMARIFIHENSGTKQNRNSNEKENAHPFASRFQSPPPLSSTYASQGRQVWWLSR